MSKGKITRRKGEYPCPYCDRILTDQSGVTGHIQMKHPEVWQEWLASKDFPDALQPGVNEQLASEAASDTREYRRKKAGVELLGLEAKERKLRMELGDGQERVVDIMEQAGAGKIQGEAQQVAQKRILGLEGQPPESWLSQLLRSPDGIKVGVDALRGILGQGGGDTTGTILRDLGFSLKDLLMSAMAPKSDGSLKIAGMDLGGVALTPELLKGILIYKAEEAKAEAELKGRESMAATFQNVFNQLSPFIAERFGTPGGDGGRDGGVSDQPQPRIEEYSCKACGAAAKLDVSTAAIGDRFNFKCPTCGELEEGIEVIDKRGESRLTTTASQRKSKKGEGKPVAGVDFVACENCGQAISILSKAPGDSIGCPIESCGHIQTLISENMPMEADTPKTKGDESLYLRNREEG